jgi:plastocyanin
MTFSHTFTQAGSFPYFCQVHQALMQAMVVVQ